LLLRAPTKQRAQRRQRLFADAEEGLAAALLALDQTRPQQNLQATHRA
jgi:hypothetical protein